MNKSTSRFVDRIDWSALLKELARVIVAAVAGALSSGCVQPSILHL